MFDFSKDVKTLSNKTVLEYHRLIWTVLAQAEKEMLVPYNAAAKATLPKQQRRDVSYYQPSELSAILGALDTEPLKWRLMVHLLAVTGCRRGENAALKWEKVDFQRGTVRIDSALLYSSKRGIYEDNSPAFVELKIIFLYNVLSHFGQGGKAAAARAPAPDSPPDYRNG